MVELHTQTLNVEKVDGKDSFWGIGTPCATPRPYLLNSRPRGHRGGNDSDDIGKPAENF
jgi:hypothetical protein